MRLSAFFFFCGRCARCVGCVAGCLVCCLVNRLVCCLVCCLVLAGALRLRGVWFKVVFPVCGVWFPPEPHPPPNKELSDSP